MISNRTTALDILKRAKARLARNAKECAHLRKEMFLCHAIKVAAKAAKAAAVGYELTNLIVDRLEGHSTLEGWLAERGIVLTSAEGDKAQATRHAWIDSLIKEFS